MKSLTLSVWLGSAHVDRGASWHWWDFVDLMWHKRSMTFWMSQVRFKSMFWLHCHFVFKHHMTKFESIKTCIQWTNDISTHLKIQILMVHYKKLPIKTLPYKRLHTLPAAVAKVPLECIVTFWNRSQTHSQADARCGYTLRFWNIVRILISIRPVTYCTKCE